MKKLIPLLLLIAVLISCNNERSIVDDASRTTLELPAKASVTADLLVLRQAINQIKAINGSYPVSLESLDINTNRPLGEFDYDTNKGIVKHKDYPKL